MPPVPSSAMAAKPAFDPRAIAGIAVKLAASAALLWLSMRGIDVGLVVDRATSLGLVATALVLVLATLQVVVGVQRWFGILGDLRHPARWRDVALALLLERFVNQSIPGLVGGDAMRAWALRHSGVPMAVLVTSIALDRVVAIVGVIVVIALTLPWLGRILPGDELLPVIQVLTAVALGALSCLILFPALIRGILPEKGRLGQLTLSLRNAIRPLRDPRMLLRATGHSIVMHVISIAMIFVLCRFLGTPLQWNQAALLLPLVVFVGLLPISINGWGVREAAMVALLGYAGVDAADALAASILFGCAVLCAGIVGGMLWLAFGRRARPGMAAPNEAERSFLP